MASEQFAIHARQRKLCGRSASRRLRSQKRVPGVLYGGGESPLMIDLNRYELSRHLGIESFYSHVLEVMVDGQRVSAVLKDLQRCPSDGEVEHVDFLRVTQDHKVSVHVPLHFLGEKDCVGVKKQGGVVSHLVSDVEVSCLPRDLPEYLEADITQLEIGRSLHLTDIQLPAGVEMVMLVQNPDAHVAIASVFKPRVQTSEVEADGEILEPDTESETTND